jgi:hypothetical protein
VLILHRRLAASPIGNWGGVPGNPLGKSIAVCRAMRMSRFLLYLAMLFAMTVAVVAMAFAMLLR